MAKVLMVVRILPRDSDTDLKTLLDKIVRELPRDVVVSDSRREEIGFGLEALVVGFLMPEKEGVGEDLERRLANIEEVGEIDVQSVTRV
ncbi:MAG: elongation factor 1-beta [Candidatus Caldarchaeum sp.]|uniref:Elongation factor 1-beta n=1 Tax=Caldiarchaeum subterraneum TaxID=311458 RepID=A0A7C5Q8Q5_CALS0